MVVGVSTPLREAMRAGMDEDERRRAMREPTVPVPPRTRIGGVVMVEVSCGRGRVWLLRWEGGGWRCFLRQEGSRCKGED